MKMTKLRRELQCYLLLVKIEFITEVWHKPKELIPRFKVSVMPMSFVSESCASEFRNVSHIISAILEAGIGWLKKIILKIIKLVTFCPS